MVISNKSNIRIIIAPDAVAYIRYAARELKKFPEEIPAWKIIGVAGVINEDGFVELQT